MYSCDGLVFSVRATDRAFVDLLDRYLEGFVGAQETPTFRFSADVGRDRTLLGGKTVRAKSRLYLGGLKIHEGIGLDEMAGRVVSGVRDQVTRRSNAFIRVRAGGVVLDRGALLMPSTPQPRLPALVASLVRAGAAYLGDEVVDIDPVQRRLHGSRLPLLLDTDDLMAFPELGRATSRRRLKMMGDPDLLGAKTPRCPVRLDELSGRFAEPIAPAWVVFPVFEAAHPTELRPMGPSEALFEMSRAMLNLHVWEERGFVVMQDLLASVPSARLMVGSIAEATELLTSVSLDRVRGGVEGDG